MYLHNEYVMHTQKKFKTKNDLKKMSGNVVLAVREAQGRTEVNNGLVA